MKRVAIVFTGGTISMQPDPEAGGFRPVLDGAAILARVPALSRLADIEAIDWGLVPASHLRFSQLIDISRICGEALERDDVDGAVIVQGTDSIEESAFAFALLVDSPKPLVVTGAMRDATSVEYDGPRNLADAVACAVSGELRGVGTVVVMHGRIIAAEDVIKDHSTDLDAFRARDGVQLGSVIDGVVRLSAKGAARARVRPFRALPATAVEDVHLVTAVTGMDGSLVRGIAALRPRGLVVAATGSGNTHPDLLAAAQELMAAGTVVCLATRCPGGTVDPQYAFPGGGATWQRAGALMSRFDGPKTRVALALALAAGLDRAELADLLQP